VLQAGQGRPVSSREPRTISTATATTATTATTSVTRYTHAGSQTPVAAIVPQRGMNAWRTAPPMRTAMTSSTQLRRRRDNGLGRAEGAARQGSAVTSCAAIGLVP
jgi:hypothetical protein